jgi:hypothetical protein
MNDNPDDLSKEMT